MEPKGSTANAMTAGEQAATGVSFRHRRWLRCRRAPLPLRVAHVYGRRSIPIYGSGGFKASTATRRLCTTLEVVGCVPCSLGHPRRQVKPSRIGFRAVVGLGGPLGPRPGRQPRSRDLSLA